MSDREVLGSPIYAQKHLTDEMRETLIQVGLDFLRIQLSEVETEIARREDKFQSFYPEEKTLPRGEADLMDALQHKKNLILKLIQESQLTPFSEVSRKHLQAIERQIKITPGWESPQAKRDQRFRAMREREMLMELVRKWLAWIKS